MVMRVSLNTLTDLIPLCMGFVDHEALITPLPEEALEKTGRGCRVISSTSHTQHWSSTCIRLLRKESGSSSVCLVSINMADASKVEEER